MLALNHNLLQGYDPDLHDGYARRHCSSLHFNSDTDDGVITPLMIEGALCTTNTGNATPDNGFPMPFSGIIDTINVCVRAGTPWVSNPLNVTTLELYIKSFSGAGGMVWSLIRSAQDAFPYNTYQVDLGIPFTAGDFFTMYKQPPVGSTVYDVLIRVGLQFDGGLPL